MTTTSSTSSCYPMSDISKQDSYLNSSSPPASSTDLESMDPFEHSLSAATFLESDCGSQVLSPPGSQHSSLHPDNQVSYQEYLMLDLMAYGLPSTEADVSFTATQMLPYPSNTPLITLGTDDHQSQTYSQIAREDVRDGFHGLGQMALDPHFQSQAIRDWSGACSTALSAENAPSPNSWLPQEAPYMSASNSFENTACPLPAVSSSNDWSTKNKLNLTVNTNMTAFKATNRLSPNGQNPSTTPYSDCSTSYVSPSAASFYFEPQHPVHASHLMANPPSIINWLHGSLNAPQSNTGGSYFEGLPTPSSATFSAVPTPTGMCFQPDCARLPSTENPATSINVNQANFVLQLPVQSKVLHSPTNLDLTSELGYLPLNGSAYEDSYLQHEGNGNQFVDSPASYCCSLNGRVEYSDGLHQASSYPDVYPASGRELSSRRNSATSSSAFDHASTFGHMSSQAGSLGRLEQASVASASVSSTDQRRSKKGKRALSAQTDSEEDEQVAKKRRCSTTSAQSVDENIINPYEADGVSALLKRAPLVGARLKPGPKSKTTLVQHPPKKDAHAPNPCREESGLTKDILKCLYNTTCHPAEAAGRPSTKRYLCRIEDCGRSFARKTAIESHLQTHLEDKPFICSLPDCNAAFVRQHDLRRHEQIHSKSKPFGCICGKSFARGDALVRHRNRGICDGSLVPRKK